MSEKTAKLTIGTDSWDFALRDGTIGPQVIDIAAL